MTTEKEVLTVEGDGPHEPLEVGAILTPEHCKKITEWEPRLASVTVAVEATNYERLMLWREFHDDKNGPRWPWKGDGAGFSICLTLLGGMPNQVCFWFQDVQNEKVMFWECTGLVGDRRPLEVLLKHCCPKLKRCGTPDAMNFGNAFDREVKT